MSYVTIEDRVDRLEALFGQFMTEMAVLNKRADDRNRAAEERHQAAEERHRAAEERMTRFETGMGEFKTETAVLNKHADERNQAAEERMTRFEAEMGEFKTEMAVLNKRADERNQAAEDRHQAAEERNRAAEERVTRFEIEMRSSKREMDKKWGDLANKLGTIIEDIVAPNLRRLAHEHFGFEAILDFMIRRSRRRPDGSGVESEFDTIIVGSTAVILGEAKSTPSLDYADAFAEKARSFFEFFPEYHGKRLILVFGSWAIADVVVARLTSHGIYALRMGEDTMELANAAAIEAR